ncbi:MAG: phenylalanine--tRNA ligase subunit beta, partial [Sediminibacterium sp.]|nr:phenylalanine--tRNA ligase subunit beta [Sediminibacterium sp.]
MKISYNWLLDYIPFKLNKDELSLVLTSIGLEVESIHYFEKYTGGLEGLVVGKIIEINPHPESDKLKVTQVFISDTLTLQIICGATNIEVGQNVAIAMDGTTIYPTNGKAQKIQAILIKGVDSLGMICAGYEIGVDNNKSGVLILNQDIKPGTLLKDIFIQYTDWIFEIGLTPNRMDANYHYGVAIDLYAYFLHHNEEYKLKQIYNVKLPNTLEKYPISIHIENNKDCSRYVGIYISDVQIKESPTWLQNNLLSIGLKPINNIVDITNFILHETGQPLHAFDADKIMGNKIIIKNFPTNTKFTTLDGIERNLLSTDLMISDEQKPICMAGIYGGLDSGITAHTKSVFLEAAFFNPIAIRKSATNHNLRTDASAHFEKGIDISNCKNALIRAAQFIQEMAGGNLSIIEDIYPNPVPPTTINLSYSFVKKLSGNNFHPQKIKDLLKSLQFDILIDKTDLLQVGVPFSKMDIKNQADLVEEIIRIDGINNIPIQKSIKIISQVEQINYSEKIIEKIETFLVGNGFSEIITNSLTNSKYYNDYQLDVCVKLLNSVSTELNILRPTLLETGLEVVSYNLNRQQSNLKLFEVGKVYSSFQQNYNEKT